MGAVYRATDRLNGQTVAFKRVLSSATQTTEGMTQEVNDLRLALAREFQMLASIRHPNVISVLDYGFDSEKQPYYTMSILQSPQDFLQAGQNQPLYIQVKLLTQLLQAISYLHRRNIIHRDLKPTNVLVENEETVRVLDFGLATLADQEDEDGMMAGTLAYMAPEVFEGMPLTHAADLYAVGVMAYELFVGRHPYNLTDVRQLMQDVMFAEPDMAPLSKTIRIEPIPELTELADETKAISVHEVGEHLAPFLTKLMAKTPEDRFSTADEALHALLQATSQPIPMETEAIRESFLQAARFVGREAELGTLLVALTQTQHGSGSTWLIGGENGVGKSRLIDEIRVRAMVSGMTVLRGQAVRDGGAPYAVLRLPLQRLALGSDIGANEASILQTILPEIEQLTDFTVRDPVPLEPQQAQERLIGAVVSLLRRETTPTLLILEDLHWATESHDLIERINGLTDNLPLMVIGSYRDDEIPDLPNVLSSMSVLKLARLTEENTTQLARSMIGTAADDPKVVGLLHKETEGNAFFLVEVVRALAEDAGTLSAISRQTLPKEVFAGGIQQVIERRVERIPAIARPLFEVAAVLGRELDTAILQRVADSDESIPTDLEEWLNIGANTAMLDIQDEIWRFSHDRLREGLLGKLDQQQMQARHAQAAQAIEQIYPDAPDKIAALAFHWGSAGNTEKELHYSKLAGQQALDTSAFTDARRLLERAIELETDLSIKRRLHYQLGEVLRGLSIYAEATEHYEQARDGSAKQNEGLALLGLGRTELDQGSHEAAIKQLVPALEALRTVDDAKHESYALYALSRAHQYMGDPKAANTYAEQALNIAKKINDQRGESLALFGLGFNHLPLGDFETARSYLSQAREIDGKIGNRRGEGFASMYLGVAAHLLGEGESAIQHVQHTLEIAVDIGDRRLESLASVNLSTIHAELGNIEQAMRDAERTITIAKAIGDQRTALFTLLNVAEFKTQLGDTAEAIDCAKEAKDLADSLQDHYNAAWALGEQAAAQTADQNYEMALAVLQQALEIAKTVEADELLCRLYTYHARTHLLNADPTQANESINAALRHPDPEQVYKPAVLKAVIATINKENSVAKTAIENAIEKLDEAEPGYLQDYMRGLAFAAKTVIEGPIQWHINIAAAENAYKAAVSACNPTGIVDAARADLTELIKVDDEFLLLSLKNYLDSVE